MDFGSLLMSLLGGGEKPGQDSVNATMGMMSGLQGLNGQLGAIGGILAPQQQAQQQSGQLDLRSLMAMFQPKHSNKIVVNPNPRGDFNDEMM